MRTALFLFCVCFSSAQLQARPALGAADTCATATPLTPGSNPGFNTWCIWPGGTNPNSITHDNDWLRVTLQPGQQLDVTAQVTGTSGSSAYYTLMRLYEFSATTCAGSELATSFANHVAAVNGTPTPKDYVVLYYAGVSSSGLSVSVTFDIDLQRTTVQTGVSYCPGAMNSLGLSGVLGVSGTSSVSASNLSFHGSNLVPNSFALLASGVGTAQVPFGDGSLCITGLLQRLYVNPVSGTGTWSAALDIPNLPPAAAIHAGELRYFQLYYRDAAGPLATGFNLTNGVCVAFGP